MSTGIEQWCGAPAEVRAPRRPPAGGGPGGMGNQPQLTEEEFAAQEKAAEESRQAIREWRLNAPLDKFAELAKMYNDAGIGIHIVKFSPGSWPEDEIEYAFNAAKAMGAVGVCDELGEDSVRAMVPVAEKMGMYAIFHQHFQFADPEFPGYDYFMNISPAVMFNFDAGHFFGSTGRHPNEIIDQYHDRIVSIHIKDKTGPDTDVENNNNNQNQVWGQGEMPLEDVLLNIKEKGYPIYCDIELEYPVKMWSTPVKEVKTCMHYARQILV